MRCSQPSESETVLLELLELREGQARVFPGKGRQNLATNESLTLESRAPSGWCQGLRLWPVWATWLRLAQAKGGPASRRPSASPTATGHGELSCLGQRGPDVLRERACLSPGTTPNLCPHTSVLLECRSFQQAKSPHPSSLACLLSLPIWAHSGPPPLSLTAWLSAYPGLGTRGSFLQ